MLTGILLAISLSQFLLAALTVSSWHKTYRPFTSFVKPALDSSCNQDNFTFGRFRN